MSKKNSLSRRRDLSIKELSDKAMEILPKLSKYDDRALAIIGAAYLDDIVRELLRARLVDDPVVIKEALSFVYGPLGGAANRIQMAYLIGIIGPQYRQGLLQINAIRNQFAHYHVVSSFEALDILKMTRGIAPRFYEEVFDGMKEGENEGRWRFTHAVGLFMVVLLNIERHTKRLQKQIDLRFFS